MLRPLHPIVPVDDREQDVIVRARWPRPYAGSSGSAASGAIRAPGVSISIRVRSRPVCTASASVMACNDCRIVASPPSMSVCPARASTAVCAAQFPFSRLVVRRRGLPGRTRPVFRSTAEISCTAPSKISAGSSKRNA